MSIDMNSGIRADCKYCGDPGFVYWNGSLQMSMAFCDACRDDLDRRKRHSVRRAAADTATSEQSGRDHRER